MLQCDSRPTQESCCKLKGRASQQTCRPTKTESCLNTYFHWEGGRGRPASFNQDLKTGEPLIKSRRCTFILFLSGLRWLVSSALILRPWSVGRVCAADNTLVKLWWRKRNNHEPLTPPSPPHRHIQMNVCGMFVPPVLLFFPPFCSETVPLFVGAPATNVPSRGAASKDGFFF